MLDPMRRYAQSWGTKIVFGLIIIVFVFWGVAVSGATRPRCWPWSTASRC